MTIKNKDKGTYRILIIEDNLGDFTLIEDYLYDHILSPKITHAKDFSEACTLLTKSEKDYQIVLLDLSLPDKNGGDLVKEIVSVCTGCPVIVLTGYAEFEFCITSLSLGVSDYLLKDELTPFALYRSITYNIERKKAYQSLQESEKRYSDLFHFSPQPMWVYALDDLSFLDVNEAAIRHYGYSREEFLSMTIKEIRPEEDLSKLMEAVELSRKHDQFYFKDIFRHQKKNGEIIYVDLQSNIISFKGRKAELILAQDITDRLEYISAIEKQNELLRDIAWKQSHEVRGPLARIMGLINLLELPNKDISLEEILSHINKSAHELDTIVKDIVKNARVVNNQN
jgi:PAS domain S-box-containing protein